MTVCAFRARYARPELNKREAAALQSGYYENLQA